MIIGIKKRRGDHCIELLDCNTVIATLTPAQALTLANALTAATRNEGFSRLIGAGGLQRENG